MDDVINDDDKLENLNNVAGNDKNNKEDKKIQNEIIHDQKDVFYPGHDLANQIL